MIFHGAEFNNHLRLQKEFVTPCNKKSKTQNGDSTKNYRFKMIHYPAEST